MHYLAKNMAEKMHQRVQDVCKDDYGETFFYSDVYFGKDENDDIVTVEEYVEGDFVKYINNNACICSNSSSVASMKAQSLVHFSYEKSEGKLMLLDLQGSGFHLFDPEIASTNIIDGGEVLYSKHFSTVMCILEKMKMMI